MLSITQLQPGVRVKYNNKPYEILKSEHVQMGRGSGIQRVRMRCLRDGSTIGETFKGNQTVEEVKLIRRPGQFLYCDNENCHFMDPQTFAQNIIAKKIINEKLKFLKEGETYQAIIIDEEFLDIELPQKIILQVKSAPPGLKGDRTSAGTKPIELENGLIVNAPLHIKVGEQIIVDSRNGGYVSRA